ncbi:MAG: DedA family protein [Alphaproteobacteria bacterium]|nr:MAG: DedA family protein [Alphaproteobacteria bacterium]
MEEIMQTIMLHIEAIVLQFGYVGIFLATVIESTFVPIPAEVTMIPAGILVAKGELNYWITLMASTAGVIVGSIINYFVGLKFGRTLVVRYGKYVMLKEHHLHSTEMFFKRYGRAAVFLGRLLLGVKHYIAFVAGVAKMNFQLFTIYTSFGALIWMLILLQAGYMSHTEGGTGNSALHQIQTIVMIVIGVSLVAWLVKKKLMNHHK